MKTSVESKPTQGPFVKRMAMHERQFMVISLAESVLALSGKSFPSDKGVTVASEAEVLEQNLSRHPRFQERLSVRQGKQPSSNTVGQEKR